MGLIHATMNTSIDACCDHTQVIADDEFHMQMSDLFGRAKALLFGRNTYELLYSYWPEVASSGRGTAAEVRLANILNEKPKYVVTKQEMTFNWNAKRVEGGAENLRSLKSQTDGMILLVASPTLVQALLQWKLVDEYHVVVSPIIAGHGPTFLSGLQSDIRPSLLSVNQLESGVIIQHYSFDTEPRAN